MQTNRLKNLLLASSGLKNLLPHPVVLPRPPPHPPSRPLTHLIGAHGRLAFTMKFFSSCIVQVELWFGGMETPPSPADPQEPYPYDRLGNLKNTFFDIFADHQLDPPQLNYVDMVSGNKYILLGALPRIIAYEMEFDTTKRSSTWKSGQKVQKVDLDWTASVIRNQANLTQFHTGVHSNSFRLPKVAKDWPCHLCLFCILRIISSKKDNLNLNSRPPSTYAKCSFIQIQYISKLLLHNWLQISFFITVHWYRSFPTIFP